MDDLDENIDSLKKNQYGKKMYDKGLGYRIGATIGAGIGIAVGFATRGKILWWGLGGLVAGGMIGYKVAEYKAPTFQLSNFTGEKKKRKFYSNKKMNKDGRRTGVS